MSNDIFLKEAERKTSTVTVLGVTLKVCELKAVDRMKYSELVKKDETREAALALLLEKGVLNEDGTNRFTNEEALKLAQGSGRVAFKLVNAILEPESDEQVKNDSAPTDDSSSNSQAT